VSVGDSLDIDFLNEVLFAYEFHRVDFVSEPGEFSIRGGIVDVFSFSEEKPYRISLFGDEVESIRTFDIETQLSIEKVKSFTIVPNLENKFISDSRDSFFEYISDKTIVLARNLNVIESLIYRNLTLAKASSEKLSKEIKHPSPKELFLDEIEFKSGLKKFPVIEFSLSAYFDEAVEFKINQKPQPSFNKQLDLLAEEFNSKTEEGYTNYLFCSGEKQVQRFHDIFEDIAKEVKFVPVIGSVHQGFIDEDLKITCFTDHQIF